MIAETPYGRLREVTRDDEQVWLLECPGCGEWAELDEDQLHGRVSCDHTFEAACGYHETHDFAAALAAACRKDG